MRQKKARGLTPFGVRSLSYFQQCIFNSQLNTSGRKPKTCDTPGSHSIDKPTEEQYLRNVYYNRVSMNKCNIRMYHRAEGVNALQQLIKVKVHGCQS